ncbi:uncharacterized protein LOC130676573 isoform X1 [Microplitis mediator]|uniref:uncharacterized protein LOC130676573 isoform X1 n=1 Tax=Microplitis mediator TaxID=375433 RepID=UPI00255582B2|nr:uncharacterized protein LOC130676573 isoform X1 [Microplitis mediator]
MGEYVAYTGIDQTMELCDIIEEPIMAGPFLKLLGFSEDHCPPEPGNYGTEDYVFSPERLADRVPPNQYLLNVTTSYEDKLLLLCQIFVKVRLVIMGASMGEYVVSTGIDQTMELCDLIEEPIMAGPNLKLLGFSEDHCPPLPGNYGTQDYVFTSTRFPDTIIPNQYLMNMTLSYEDKLLLLCQIFFKAS